MKRELFIEGIEALRKQSEYDLNVCSNLSKAFPNAFEANLFPENHLLTDVLMNILQSETNDIETCTHGYSWIEYFCHELDFGKKYIEGCVTENGKNIDLSNSSKLWDMLNDKGKKK